MTGSTHVGLGVHYVHGKQCCAAIVTGVARLTDAHRDRYYVGLRAWTDLDEINRPLSFGGVRHDPGTPGEVPWSCNGRDYEPDTWHRPGAEVG